MVSGQRRTVGFTIESRERARLVQPVHAASDCPCGFLEKHKAKRQDLFPRTPFLGSLNA
jgi:hypothetical protein